MFDRLASSIAKIVSGAYFFTFCLFLVLIWVPTLFFLDVNTSQLIINTITTIITFLLVALLQNTQDRFEEATNAKLNAIAEALANFMETSPELDSNHAKKLRKVVGIEKPS